MGIEGASNMLTKEQEDQREANSNPSPSTGQSKQGLTVSHTDAPTLSPASENEVDYKSMYQSLLADHAREIEIADKLLRRLRENARAPDVGIELCNEVDSYLKERG